MTERYRKKLESAKLTNEEETGAKVQEQFDCACRTNMQIELNDSLNFKQVNCC